MLDLHRINTTRFVFFYTPLFQLTELFTRLDWCSIVHDVRLIVCFGLDVRGCARVAIQKISYVVSLDEIKRLALPINTSHTQRLKPYEARTSEKTFRSQINLFKMTNRYVGIITSCGDNIQVLRIGCENFLLLPLNSLLKIFSLKCVYRKQTFELAQRKIHHLFFC